MDQQELQRLGRKLRTLGSTRGDWLTYIDGTLPLLTQAQPLSSPEKSGKIIQSECSACAARRKKKAETQKRWRHSKETKNETPSSKQT